MKNFFKAMFTNAGVAGEILHFLWQRKLWWLIPMVFTLLLIGFILVFAAGSGALPFLYPLI